MKFIVLSVVFVAASISADKFDNVDVDAIIKNERLLQNHFECMLEDKGCTPEAQELKKRLPEVMETCCANCSEKQKEGAKKMTQYLIDNKPEILKKMLDKYDPDRKYMNKCSDKLTEAGFDTNLLEANEYDILVKRKYAYESFLRSEYVEHNKPIKSFILPEVPLDDTIPTVPFQLLDPTLDEYVDTADDLQYERSLKTMFNEVLPDEVNLREFNIVGGIFHIYLLYHPPQPHPLIRFHMTMNAVMPPKSLELVPFYAEFSPPPLPWLNLSETRPSVSSTSRSVKSVRSKKLTSKSLSKTDQRRGDTTDSEEMQKYKDAQEKHEKDIQMEKEKMVSFSLGLPEGAIYLERPTICMWDSTFKTWTACDIYDVDFEDEERKVVFRSSRFGIFGLAVKKHLNFPYKNWDIRPNNDDSISLVLAGSKVTIGINIYETNIKITDFEYNIPQYLIGLNGLNELISKDMTLPRFIKALRSRGLDLFPEHDIHCYYNATSEKHWPMSQVTYFSMARMAIRYNFSSSKWNSEVGRRSIILRVRDYNPSDSSCILRAFNLLHVTPLKSETLLCTEDDEVFSDIPTDPPKFQPNLYYLMKSTSGVSDRAKINEFSQQTVQTLTQFLARTRLFSFS